MSVMRLQKWLAEAGLCSRREGERWIEAGRVSVNGEVVRQQGVQVGPDAVVTVDGQPVTLTKSTLRVVVALHKPVGVICSRHDPEGRPSVYPLVEGSGVRLVSVGRLDYNSEGLLLFTNDGELANKLTHPRHEVPRIYRVRVHGRVGESLLERLRAGVMLDDGPTGPLEVTVERVVGANSWVNITLKEGRNRIIRRIFSTVDMEVARLIRISYGGIELADIPAGAWRYLTRSEVARLSHWVR
jgi:23S rRNA pseudouridine2605 synthase